MTSWSTTIAGSDTYGIEFDGRWTSDFGLSVTTDDTWENPTTNTPGIARKRSEDQFAYVSASGEPIGKPMAGEFVGLVNWLGSQVG